MGPPKTKASPSKALAVEAKLAGRLVGAAHPGRRVGKALTENSSSPRQKTAFLAVNQWVVRKRQTESASRARWWAPPKGGNRTDAAGSRHRKKPRIMGVFEGFWWPVKRVNSFPQRILKSSKTAPRRKPSLERASLGTIPDDPRRPQMTLFCANFLIASFLAHWQVKHL